jgi:RNAse (barnase) inhibitor barstar
MKDEQQTVVLFRGSTRELLAQQVLGRFGIVSYVVDVGHTTDRDTFFSVTYKALFRSDAYGHNLDAFEDVGADVIHGDPAEGRYFDWSTKNLETRVVFTGLDTLLVGDLDFCKSLLEVLASCSRAARAEGGELVWVIHAPGEAYDILMRVNEM